MSRNVNSRIPTLLFKFFFLYCMCMQTHRLVLRCVLGLIISEGVSLQKIRKVHNLINVTLQMLLCFLVILIVKLIF